MINKPIDEMSLRHLFSTNYASNILKIEYWGPVLNHLGHIESSPDCLVLDKRKEPYILKKCEFKYIPNSFEDFKFNGNFNIAIVWDLPNRIDKNQFQDQLREQNNCLEILVLKDLHDFRKIQDYSIPDEVNFTLIQRMIDFLLPREPDVIFTAYLIAQAYPHNINSEKLVEVLVSRFQKIQDMSPRGRGNSVARFRQMNPPSLINYKYGRYFRWNDDFEPKAAISTMEKLMRENFGIDIPEIELVERIK